jgi:hypothetical protein
VDDVEDATIISEILVVGGLIHQKSHLEYGIATPRMAFELQTPIGPYQKSARIPQEPENF